MKDAASCDNPRLGAHTLRPAGLRMGEPARRCPGIPLGNSYLGGGQPGELKHLSTRRRRNQLRDSPSSGERKGTDGQTGERAGASLYRRRGCRASRPGAGAPGGDHPGEPNGMGGPAAQGHSPVGAPWDGPRRRSLSRAGHVKPGPKQGGPPSKPEYSPVTDSAQVP